MRVTRATRLTLKHGFPVAKLAEEPLTKLFGLGVTTKSREI